MVFATSSNARASNPGGFRAGRETRSRPLHAHRTLTLVASDGVRQGVVSPTVRDLLTRDTVGSPPFVMMFASVGASKGSAQWLRNTAILFSICLHVAIGIALFDSSNSDDQFGALAEKTDAISLATQQTLVLESIETETVQTAAAASAESQAGSVQSADSAPQAQAETKEAVEAAEPPPQPVDVAEVTPSPAIPTEDPLPVIRGGAAPDDVREVKAIETAKTTEDVKRAEVATKEVAQERTKKADTKEEERQATAQAASRASASGSTTSRASAAQAAISGRVSASRGNILNYAARIRAILARNKPGGDGHRGTTRISFGLTATGQLSYAEVASSSGRPDLDQAALGAVRKAAPFGTPPANVAPNELRFTIPFYFH